MYIWSFLKKAVPLCYCHVDHHDISFTEINLNQWFKFILNQVIRQGQVGAF